MKQSSRFRIAWILLALSTLVGSIALAEQMIGVGKPIWNHRDDRSGAVGCITFDDSGACKLFPAGEGDVALASFVNVAASGAANCAWVGDAAVALTTSGHVTSGGGFTPGAASGGSAGFALASPGARWDGKERADELISGRVPGMDTGFCTISNTQNGQSMYVPCHFGGGSGTNCASYNGANLGACIQPTPTQLNAAGLFVVCNGNIHAWIERIVK